MRIYNKKKFAYGVFSLTLGLLVLVTVCCYLVFALFYVAVYVITSRSYYTIVSGRKDLSDRRR